MRKILSSFLVVGIFLTGCTVAPTEWSANIVQDPVVLAALNSKEGQEAKLLVDNGNRFADCIDAYNEWLKTANRGIPEDVIEQTRVCRLQLEAQKTETSEEASADVVVLHKAYHPSCNHIPVKEELLRVEVAKTDLSTFASWSTPEVVPSYAETELLREALPLASCQDYIARLFSMEESNSLLP